MVRLRPLDRKLLRDLWRLKWQLLAIALLIACGVSVAVMSFSAQQALTGARSEFYARNRFADGFASAVRAPMSLRQALSHIEGVETLDTRIIQGGLMRVTHLSRPVLTRLISLPEGEAGGLNRVQLTAGRMPAPGRANEAVALRAFLDAAGVRLGTPLTAVIHGRAFSFTVVGAVVAPEFIYNPAPDSFMPDDAHQAVIWAPRAAVEQAAGMSGAFNNVTFTLSPGAQMAQVLEAVDRRLTPYGGRAAYARKDQPSENFLSAELKELSTSGYILPPIFLLVAASLVHLVMGRLVESEREQIGLLKAFGYTHLEAASPYLKMALAVGLVGVIGGGMIGAVLGAAILHQYADYFRFPHMPPAFNWTSFWAAGLVSILAVVAGALRAIYRAAALSPAVAMQPPRPMRFRKGWLDKVLQTPAIDDATRMIARNLARFPARALLVAMGLSASLSLMVATEFLFDSFDKVIDRTYFQTQRWSEGVSFAEPRSIASRADTLRFPGVLAGEGVRIAPARLRANGREKLSRVMGLEPGAKLDQPLDTGNRPVPVLGGGIVISSALADQLAVKPGDRVLVEPVEAASPARSLPVTGLADDYSGYSAYMDRRALNGLMQEGDLISAVHLLVSPEQRQAFYRVVDDIPQIAAASSRDDTVASWRTAMAEAFKITIVFYIGFAAAMAFGVTYNMARITLSERSRDLATLHVLGFGHGECAYILLGELAILVLGALPVGLYGGFLLSQGLALAYSRSDMRLPPVLSSGSVGIALAAYLAAVASAAALVARPIWTLDLVAVLKTRE